MKKIFISMSLVVGYYSALHATDGNLTASQVEAVQKLIQLYNYRCDSVNFALRSTWDGSIRVTCNENRYVYEVKDVGGTWTVKVK